MERFRLCILLLVGVLPVIMANFPFPCSTMGCSFCGTTRMQQLCQQFCNNCNRKSKAAVERSTFSVPKVQPGRTPTSSGPSRALQRLRALERVLGTRPSSTRRVAQQQPVLVLNVPSTSNRSPPIHGLDFDDDFVIPDGAHAPEYGVYNPAVEAGLVEHFPDIPLTTKAPFTFKQSPSQRTNPASFLPLPAEPPPLIPERRVPQRNVEPYDEVGDYVENGGHSTDLSDNLWIEPFHGDDSFVHKPAVQASRVDSLIKLNRPASIFDLGLPESSISTSASQSHGVQLAKLANVRSLITLNRQRFQPPTTAKPLTGYVDRQGAIGSSTYPLSVSSALQEKDPNKVFAQQAFLRNIAPAYRSRQLAAGVGSSDFRMVDDWRLGITSAPTVNNFRSAPVARSQPTNSWPSKLSIPAGSGQQKITIHHHRPGEPTRTIRPGSTNNRLSGDSGGRRPPQHNRRIVPQRVDRPYVPNRPRSGSPTEQIIGRSVKPVTPAPGRLLRPTRAPTSRPRVQSRPRQTAAPRRSVTRSPSRRESCPKRDWSACISRTEANSRFESCCRQEGMTSPGCLRACRYGKNKEQLEQIFMIEKSCPVARIPDFLYCASQGKDATRCCRSTGVLDGKRSICSPFCDPAGGLPAFSFKYLKCLAQLASIEKCYLAYID